MKSCQDYEEYQDVSSGIWTYYKDVLRLSRVLEISTCIKRSQVVSRVSREIRLYQEVSNGIKRFEVHHEELT